MATPWVQEWLCLLCSMRSAHDEQWRMHVRGDALAEHGVALVPLPGVVDNASSRRCRGHHSIGLRIGVNRAMRLSYIVGHMCDARDIQTTGWPQAHVCAWVRASMRRSLHLHSIYDATLLYKSSALANVT